MASRVHPPPLRRSALALLVALLPALLLVSSLGGETAWIHAHGDQGPHVHLLPAGAGPDEHGDLAAWHDAHHGSQHEDGAPRDHESPPDGLKFDVPGVLPRSARTLSEDVSVHLRVSLAASALEAPRSAPPAWLRRRPDPCAAPPWPRGGTGLVAVLRSSHAFLS